MNEVIEFPKEKDPHATGEAKCEKCNHKWVAVVHVGVTDFECPKCEFCFGAFIGPTVPEEGGYKWRCLCGWDTFSIVPDGPMCRQCGTIQEGY